MLRTLLVSSPREVKNRQINMEIKIDLTSIHLIKLDIQKNITETPRKPDQRTINKFSLKKEMESWRTFWLNTKRNLPLPENPI